MIVLINPNSTTSMTNAMLNTAMEMVPSAHIEGWTSKDGPPAIQGVDDGIVATRPLLKLVQDASDKGASAIIIGCFDDTALDEARSIANCPVLGIGQAAYHFAAMCGPRFSVVTTLDVSVPILEANIHRYGFGGALAKVRASNVPVLDLEDASLSAEGPILDEIKTAAEEDGISSVVLGCGGMVRLRNLAAATINVKVIDGVQAATLGASLLSR